MKKIVLYLTANCNTDQGFCYDIIKCAPGRPENLLPDAQGIITSAARNGFDHVSFSGGEPTLHFGELQALIIYAKSLGMTTQLKTDGWWGEEGTVENCLTKLYGAGLDYLRISFDSRKFYRGSILNRANVFRAITQGFEKFRKRQFAVMVPYGETDFSEFENAEFNVERLPFPNADYKLTYTVTGIDPVTHTQTTETVKFRGFRFTVSWDKKVFITSEGLSEFENRRTLTDRYVGSLNENTFEELYARYLVMVGKL